MAEFTIHADDDEIEQLQSKLPERDIPWIQFLLNEIDGSGDVGAYVRLTETEIELLGQAMQIAWENAEDDDMKRKYSRLGSNLQERINRE